MSLEITYALEEKALGDGSVCHWVLVSKAQDSTFLGTHCRALGAERSEALLTDTGFQGLRDVRSAHLLQLSGSQIVRQELQSRTHGTLGLGRARDRYHCRLSSRRSKILSTCRSESHQCLCVYVQT